MNKYDAMMVLENHRIRSPKKLYAAAEALLAYDAVTYHHDVRRLVDRAEEARGSRTPPAEFRRSTSAQWLGNGFGTAPARYTVRVDGREVGLIDSMGRAYGWTFRDTRPERPPTARIRREYLADLKAVVRDIVAGREVK